MLQHNPPTKEGEFDLFTLVMLLCVAFKICSLEDDFLDSVTTMQQSIVSAFLCTSAKEQELPGMLFTFVYSLAKCTPPNSNHDVCLSFYIELLVLSWIHLGEAFSPSC